MKNNNRKIRVLVNGYGVIGKRVADAISLQDDMELVGVSDVSTDWRAKMAIEKGYHLYASTKEAFNSMKEANIPVTDIIENVLKKVDVVVDATPKGIGAQNKKAYDKAGVKSIFQGGEKHELTGYSFVAQANYKEALGRESLRCVSCNTTGLSRIIAPLYKQGVVKKVRATLFRRATDPWESHKNAMLNTVVPEKDIPSHQGPDVQTILSGLDITTVAVAGPFTISHLHIVFIELTKELTREEVMKIYEKAPRIVFVKKEDGVEAMNSVIEIMRDLKRSRNDMWEVALWKDIMQISGKELTFVYQVHNEAIVVPENIDAIRALTNSEKDSEQSIRKTDIALGIRAEFYRAEYDS